MKVSTCFWVLTTSLFISFLAKICADCPIAENAFENGKIVYEKNGDWNLTTAPEYYLLRFRCNKGYEREGPKAILCQGGKWSSNFPKCIGWSCTNPPNIPNAVYEIDRGLIIGSVATYSCNAGFELRNETISTLTCKTGRRNARWDGEHPVCLEKTKCPEPEVSPQGTWEGGRFVDDEIKYACKKGFEMVGSDRATCLLGGNWSSERPRCRPLFDHCPDPPNVENGTVKAEWSVTDYYLPYEEARVVCDPGFSYFGESEFIMCTEELTWNFEFGKCLETFCERPEPPTNGKIVQLEGNNQTEFPHGYEISYICEEGYRLHGDIYRSCDAGNWTKEEPFCEDIRCPNPRTIENGYALVNSLKFREKAVFYCYSGYHLIGSQERYCLSNGQWSGELARCNHESNYCDNPGVPLNGRKSGQSYKKGDIVEFACYPGFSLIGSKTRECQENRTWSGENVKCLGARDFDNPAEVSEKLKEIVNDKAEEQAVELEKYDTMVQNMSFVIVNGTKRQKVQTQRILNLSGSARYIFYFLFDVSGSVQKENFDISIKFAKALVKKVGITENGARAAALTFSTKPTVEFNAVQYSTTEDVHAALDKIQYSKGGTATNNALRLIREEVIPLTKERLGRTGLKHVVFILTDGRANTGGDPEDEAEKLKKNQVEIYCIGITGDILKNSLYRIASKPTEEHVFILNNYMTLEWLIQEVTNGTIDYSTCGLGLEKVGKSKNQQRIIGGTQANDPWPWMAALYITDYGPNELELQCGGSIIGKRWILTAAHCVCVKDSSALRPPKQVVVKLGLTDVKNFTYLQEFESAMFFKHNKYNYRTLDNDVALILLRGAINYNAYVRPICLPPAVIPADSRLYKADETAYAAGWGHDEKVDPGKPVSTKALRNLKQLFVPLKSRKRCQDALIAYNQEYLFTESMICAGTGAESGDTCVGDSGGPLMQSQLNQDGIIFWTQVGIVSWGKGCNQPGTYGYYAHVNKLLPFISSVMTQKNEELHK